MSTTNAYSNPEYMTLDEIIQLLNEYKRAQINPLNEPNSNKFNTLPSKRPPNRRPPSPPKTPPPILYRYHVDPLPLYQNLPFTHSSNFSQTSIISSNATMIVRDSITPPKPLMTSSRLNLNPYQKQLSKNTIKNFSEIQEDFSVLEEEEECTGMTKIIESTRITRDKSPNENYLFKQKITRQEIAYNNPNYYFLKNNFEHFSSNMEVNENLESPNTSLINRVESLNSISPPSPFKTGPSKYTENYFYELSPSKHCLLNHEEFSKEILVEKVFTCDGKNCFYDSCESSESCSSTSTSGYKSNQSTISNFSMNSANSSQQAELNYFIEMNKQRLDRLKMKRVQLISSSSSCHSIKSNGN
ncbi:unnamed protein product [Brachionus calyciflorus]|uniref:Uncharacterized protein n=1 Tax=Brachionus calyciflorus TaxID=104777 RepID=A0A813YE98_9BILA|nr:unnamed protein product [Brachionus calyciflorus]